MPDTRYAGAAARAFADLTARLQPVAEAITDRLPPLPRGARVVDLACGSGEPGLTVLRRLPHVTLLGVDASPDMLALARARLRTARFVERDLADLRLPPRSVDAVVSRFGFLCFGDLGRSAAEFARVTRPGAAFSLAVWDRTARNPVTHGALESLRDMVDPTLLPPLDEHDRRAVDGVAAGTLAAVGVSELGSALFTWTPPFAGFAPLWDLVAGPGMWQPAVDTLDDDGRAELRRRYRARLAPHRRSDGSYRIPISCRLLWGRV